MSESFRELVKIHGSQRAAARALGINESSLRYKLDKEAKDERRAALRSTSLPAAIRFPVPAEGVSYFILTSAQDKHEDSRGLLQQPSRLPELVAGGVRHDV
jgi:hypothetical protein